MLIGSICLVIGIVVGAVGVIVVARFQIEDLQKQCKCVAEDNQYLRLRNMLLEKSMKTYATALCKKEGATNYVEALLQRRTSRV